jgi:cytochrome c-type biogenesis protein CcsB
MIDSSLLLSIVTFVFGLAGLLYIVSWIFRKEGVGIAATWVTVVAVVGDAAGIILRWYESYQGIGGYGHAPMSNIYESLVFFALTIGLIYLVVERKYRNRVIGCFAMPLAFFALAYASFGTSAQIQPLIPALKSNWLIAHVMTCFVGYSGFAVGFGASVLYLVKDKNAFHLPPSAKWIFYILSAVLWVLSVLSLLFVIHNILVASSVKLSHPAILTTLVGVFQPLAVGYKSFYAFIRLPAGGHFPMIFAIFLVSCGATSTLFYLKADAVILKRLPDLKILDELTHQLIMFGFLFLTAGIITGSVWANSAWGRYWGWDPKETWSLITWFIYATLLHARLMRGWRGAPIAILSIVGFLAVMFTYFGVNLLPGLHSYGAMKG